MYYAKCIWIYFSILSFECNGCKKCIFAYQFQVLILSNLASYKHIHFWVKMYICTFYLFIFRNAKKKGVEIADKKTDKKSYESTDHRATRGVIWKRVIRAATTESLTESLACFSRQTI